MITIDEFEDLMNEGTQVSIGRYSFGHGTILRRCDLITFMQEYHDYVQSIEEAMDEEAAQD